MYWVLNIDSKKEKLVEKTTNIMYTSVAYGDIEYVL